MRFWLQCITLAAIMGLHAVHAAGPRDRTVVVLLFDGFAPALLDDAPAPTLARMRKEGAWTHHLLPVFPSISIREELGRSWQDAVRYLLTDVHFEE